MTTLRMVYSFVDPPCWAVDPTYTEIENCTDLIRTRTYPDFDESPIWAMGQVQTPHTHHNESYVHWTIHVVYPIGTAAIIVHIDSFNGRNEEIKEPCSNVYNG